MYLIVGFFFFLLLLLFGSSPLLSLSLFVSLQHLSLTLQPNPTDMSTKTRREGERRLVILLLLVHRDSSGTHVDEQQQSADDAERLCFPPSGGERPTSGRDDPARKRGGGEGGARTEEVEPKVVLLRVAGVDAPPVVDEDVGDRKEQNEERGRVLGLETDDDPTENERKKTSCQF